MVKEISRRRDIRRERKLERRGRTEGIGEGKYTNKTRGKGNNGRGT